MPDLLPGDLARFHAKITQHPSGCWLWTASISADGYGKFSVRHRDVRAHRFAWLINHGPIPDGLVIDHLCRVRHCVNVDHLDLVDNRTNLMRGNTLAAANVRKTHCPADHEYTPENTLVKRNGRSRGCRECNRQYLARRRAAQKADR